MLRVLTGAAVISFAPVFVRLVDVPPTTSAFYRTLFGGLMLVAYVRLKGGRLFSGRPAATALIIAGFFFALDLWLWHRSIWYVGPGLATLLANFQVFFVALAGILFLGERFRRILWIAIPMALAGLSMIVGFDWGSLARDYRAGLVFGLLTALAYAAYLLSLRSARMLGKEATPQGDLAVASIVSAALLFVVVIVEDVPMGIPTVADGALLVAYALVAQVIGWVLIAGGLSRVPASIVALLLLLQPTLAFLWDVLFFSRPFGVQQAVGATVSMTAIYLGSRPHNDRSGESAKGAG
jgi:drug/metabolite transporter (DMT)-like permease